MREIKFRAWDKKLKKMFVPNHMDGNGTLVTDEQHNEGCVCTPNRKGTHPIEYPYPYVLMQYTGLKDKNGKEIYEGDIFNIQYKYRRKNGNLNNSHRTYSRVAKWIQHRSGIGFNFGSKYKKDPGLTEYEVIGNIYENPDLLKSK